MSEQEELQKGRNESKTRSIIEGVSKYLDTLSAEIDECFTREWSAWIIYFVAWFGWAMSSFLDFPPGHSVMQMIFIISIFYEAYRRAITARKVGEFVGALKMLELLGMIPPTGGNRRRQRKIWSEGVDIVKGWFTRKKEVQEKVYAPV